jgi:hypothetical protein
MWNDGGTILIYKYSPGTETIAQGLSLRINCNSEASMKQNIIHIGLDIDDTQYHGSALSNSTGEVLDFKCRPPPKGLGSRALSGATPSPSTSPNSTPYMSDEPIDSVLLIIRAHDENFWVRIPRDNGPRKTDLVTHNARYEHLNPTDS